MYNGIYSISKGISPNVGQISILKLELVDFGAAVQHIGHCTTRRKLKYVDCMTKVSSGGKLAVTKSVIVHPVYAEVSVEMNSVVYSNEVLKLMYKDIIFLAYY